MRAAAVALVVVAERRGAAALADAVRLALVHQVPAQVRAHVVWPPFQAQALRRQASVGAVLALVHRGRLQHRRDPERRPRQPLEPGLLRPRQRAREVRVAPAAALAKVAHAAAVRVVAQVVRRVVAARVGVAQAVPPTADRRCRPWR